MARTCSEAMAEADEDGFRVLIAESTVCRRKPGQGNTCEPGRLGRQRLVYGDCEIVVAHIAGDRFFRPRKCPRCARAQRRERRELMVETHAEPALMDLASEQERVRQ